jgi:Fe2+ transport system protein FeoA
LLTTLSAPERAEIIRIEGGDASQLSGFGFYPGAIIQVQQRFPSYIIRTDQTELALEREVASRIWVKKIEDLSSKGKGNRQRWRRRGGSRW